LLTYLLLETLAAHTYLLSIKHICDVISTALGYSTSTCLSGMNHTCRNSALRAEDWVGLCGCLQTNALPLSQDAIWK